MDRKGVIDLAEAETIAELIAKVARVEIMGRWRKLSAGQIREKRPGDLVTEADVRTEIRLAAELEAAYPGTVVVGEEGAAADPARLDVLKGAKPVWVLDPVDGTAAFAAGNPRFTTIATLMADGRATAAWIQAPALGVRAHAVRGLGCVLDGAPASMGGEASLMDAQVLGPGGALGRGGRGRGHARLAVRAARYIQSIGFGVDVLDLLAGAADAAVFVTNNPWEMPGGALMAAEAGGIVADRRGRAYDLWTDVIPPCAVARNNALAQEIAEYLAKVFAPEAHA